VPNPGQEDSDAGTDDDSSRPGIQRYGDLCDGDINQDGAVNFVDVALLRAAFLTDDPAADLDGNGTVDFRDLAILRSRFLQQPGPGAGEF